MPIGKLQGDVWTTPRLPVLVFITVSVILAYGGMKNFVQLTGDFLGKLMKQVD